MNDRDIVKTINDWQRQARTTTRGVWVSYFDIQPQASGFVIDLQIHEDGVTDPEMGSDHSYVYGETLSDVFDKASELIESKRQELLKALGWTK